MKTLVRAAVVAMVFAGAVASAFTPKTQTHVLHQNSLVVSSAVPIPRLQSAGWLHLTRVKPLGLSAKA